MRILLSAICTVILTSGCVSTAQQTFKRGPRALGMQYIADRAVRIVVEQKKTEKGKLIYDWKELGWGSGTVLRSTPKYSIIQTALHVVDDPLEETEEDKAIFRRIYIEFRDLRNKLVKKIYGVEVVEKHEAIDAALLLVKENLGVNTPIAKEVKIGDAIHVLSYPYLGGVSGSQLSYSYGYVGTVGIDKTGAPGSLYGSMRFGVWVYMGSSGAAFFNERGEVAGIVSIITGWSLGFIFIPQEEAAYGSAGPALRKYYRKGKYSKDLL